MRIPSLYRLINGRRDRVMPEPMPVLDPAFPMPHLLSLPAAPVRAYLGLAIAAHWVVRDPDRFIAFCLDEPEAVTALVPPGWTATRVRGYLDNLSHEVMADLVTTSFGGMAGPAQIQPGTPPA